MERKKQGKRVVTTAPIETDSKQTLVTQTQGLLILHIDVDQGECTLFLKLSNTKVDWCCVIDGGYSDKGRGALARYLTAFGVKTVDALVCSHFDGDHTKGLTSFLTEQVNFEVSCLYVRNDNDKEKKSNTKLNLLGAAKARKVKVVQIKEEQLPDVGELKIRCIHAESAHLQDENDGSLAFIFHYGNFRYYTAGDLPSEKEKGLLTALDKIDAFKCGHHGSANSTPPQLLELTEPLLAFISCGHQSFGHPTYDVIERLAESRSLKAFYMTNCIHNRKIANPKYDQTEAQVAQSLIDLFPKDHQELTRKLLSEDGIYNADEIASALKIFEESKSNDDNSRLTRRLLKAAERALKHQKWISGNNSIRAVVAGSKDVLGTIALYVPLETKEDPVLCVGFTTLPKEEKKNQKKEKEKGVFKWHAYQRSNENPKTEDLGLESIGNLVLRAIHEIESSEEWEQRPVVTPVKKGRRMVKRRLVKSTKAKSETEKQPEKESEKPLLSTPLKKAFTLVSLKETLNSPGTGFSDTMKVRLEKYHRFDVPTVVGLHSREEKTEYVPFCYSCRVDIYKDDNLVPVFKIECSTCEDRELYVHRTCYEADMKKELFTNGEDVAEVDQQGCPMCEKVDEMEEYEDDLDSTFEEY